MSNEIENFKLDIFSRERAEVYLSCAESNTVTSSLVKELDNAFIRVVGDVTGHPRSEERVRRILTGCSGAVSVLPLRSTHDSTTDPSLLADLRIVVELGIPVLILKERGVLVDVVDSSQGTVLRFGTQAPSPNSGRRPYGPVSCDNENEWLADESIPSFVREVLRPSDRMRAYAFFIGRLERDFTHAREAFRAAVENEAGMPLLWVDDGRHRTNVQSVREQTRLLVKNASLVIADLTLGVESPERENPSRAHEIGMSIAFGRKLLLFSQEPRRYPYYSIGDLQMVFWSNEADLECKTKELLRNCLDSFGRMTWNHQLAGPGYEPKIGAIPFHFDQQQRYVGPKTPRFAGAGHSDGLFRVVPVFFVVVLVLVFAVLIASTTR